MSNFLTISFLILYPIIPILGWIIARAGGVKPLRLSLPMFFLWSYIAFSYIGILPLYFKWIPYRVYGLNINNQEILFNVFILTSSNLIFLCLGFAISNFIQHNNQNKIEKNYQYSIVGVSTKKLRIMLLIFTLITIVIIYDYLKNVPAIAIVVSLTRPSEVAEVRSSMTTDFAGKLHWYSLFYQDIIVFITLLAAAILFLEKRKINIILFSFIFLISSFASLMTGQKGPFLWLLIGLFLIWIACRYNYNISVKLIIKIFFFITLVVVVLYLMFMGSGSIIDAFNSAMSRGFTGKFSGAYHYLRIFPDIEPYLYGRSFPNPKGILPYEVYPLTIKVMEMVKGNVRGVTGTMPTVFWGEIYANFGPVVAAIIGFPLGFFIGLLDQFLKNSKKNPVSIALYVWLMLYIRKLTGTGLSMLFIPTSLIVIGLTHYILKKWRGNLDNNLYSKI